MSRRNRVDCARDVIGRAAMVLAGLWLGVLLMSRGDPVQGTGRLEASPAALPPGSQAPPGSAPPAEDTPAEPVAPDPDLLMDHVRRLAEDIGPRPAGSPQEAQAAHYVAGYLRGLGYVTAETTGIALDGTERTTRNVVGAAPLKPGAPPGLLIGAHYDSFMVGTRSPGGNDNASGVAVMLETARLCAGTTPACPLYFAGFGGEERQDADPGHCHYGSRHFYAHQPRPLAAMIAVDMVGVGERLCLRYVEPAPEPLLELLRRAASEVGIAVVCEPDGGASDEEPFARGGVPAVWLQRRDDPAQHTEGDTADRVEPVYLQSAATLLLQLISDLTPEHLDALVAWSTGRTGSTPGAASRRPGTG